MSCFEILAFIQTLLPEPPPSHWQAAEIGRTNLKLSLSQWEMSNSPKLLSCCWQHMAKLKVSSPNKFTMRRAWMWMLGTCTPQICEGYNDANIFLIQTVSKCKVTPPPSAPKWSTHANHALVCHYGRHLFQLIVGGLAPCTYPKQMQWIKWWIQRWSGDPHDCKKESFEINIL